jgi:hypothetical protein
VPAVHSSGCSAARQPPGRPQVGRAADREHSSESVRRWTPRRIIQTGKLASQLSGKHSTSLVGRKVKTYASTYAERRQYGRARLNANELVGLNSDVIFAFANAQLVPLSRETRAIPIVFVGLLIQLGLVMLQALPIRAATSPDSAL